MYGDKMEKIRFQICEKELTLYPAQGENRPLIVFNTVMGDGEELAQAMRAMDAPDCNLLVVGKLQWYHDMTPWSCPPLSMRCTAATASRGWPACPAPCGFRSSGNTCFGMN